MEILNYYYKILISTISIFAIDLIADYFCALSRPIMLMAVLDIVSEYVPTLEALNLDGNKLYMIEKLDVLYKKFPRLKILYIGDNKVNRIYKFNKIQIYI